MLYELIDFLSKNETSELEIKNTIDNYILIEGKNKTDIKDIRDIISNNSSMIFKAFNDTIVNMELKDRKNIYCDKDVAEILGKTETTIKNWRKNGRLKYEQEGGKGHKVKIHRDSIDMLVRECLDDDMKRRWKNNKK